MKCMHLRCKEDATHYVKFSYLDGTGSSGKFCQPHAYNDVKTATEISSYLNRVFMRPLNKQKKAVCVSDFQKIIDQYQNKEVKGKYIEQSLGGL